MIAARPADINPPPRVQAVPRFQRLFRRAAGLDFDKMDLRRYNDFVHDKLYDLLVCGAETAKSHGRKVVLPADLPIAKGLRACTRVFRDLDEEIELAPILNQLAARPPIDAVFNQEIQTQLPDIIGGLSVALARSFKILDPELKNPQAVHWQRTIQLFDLLL
jgi:Domain of unknown function (DUF1931)